jgi:hypothetical protein
MTTGICRNPGCSKAAAAEIVDWYPGPGEYCPECGEALHPAESRPPAGDAGELPFPALSPEAYSEFEARKFSALELPKGTPFWLSRRFLGAVAVILAAAVGYAFLGPVPILGRPAAPAGPAVSAIQVCRSSVTDRLAGDVVRTFAAQSGTEASRFELVNGGTCDVRFSAGVARAGGDVVGHDGVVIVVNPRNPVTQLTLTQVRAILTGAVTDWAELGGPQGPIVSMAPPDGSDETALLTTRILHDGKLGSTVHRKRSSAEIVRAVAAPSGRAKIGLVAFSAAVPAKIVKIVSMPSASTLSIADHRYPFSLSVSVRQERAERDPLASALIAFARSDAAQTLVLRDGLVTKAGF